MNEVFYLRQNHYNLRNLNVFATDNPLNKFMLNSTVHRANQLWQTLPSEVKDCSSLQLFEKKIKTCRCDRCQCQICLRYLSSVGYFYLYCCSVVESWRNCVTVKHKWPKCNFAGKTINVTPWILSTFIRNVIIIAVGIFIVFHVT